MRSQRAIFRELAQAKKKININGEKKEKGKR
jgi:hypothetical protein